MTVCPVRPERGIGVPWSAIPDRAPVSCPRPYIDKSFRQSRGQDVLRVGLCRRYKVERSAAKRQDRRTAHDAGFQEIKDYTA